ncbi:MAG: hypothetical protein V2J25_01825 [Desulfatiglans sp.]|nr:MoaD/ThiS family protein [Thermodesulfobacteriota bacterium]MEE4351587.1 hypothetical protein [Desulfatiglans sp.]
MKESTKAKHVSIGIFGRLRSYMDEQNLPYRVDKEVSPSGETGYHMASTLGIPVEKIEAVFRNGRVINIHDRLFPGDRVAFFPYGTPGPYRVFLGMARENRERALRESKELGKA